MNFEDYLLRDVKPSEFKKLKAREKEIVSKAINGFNEEWKPKVKEVRATFKYNLERHMIGIHIEKNGGQYLIDTGKGLNEGEYAVVNSLYIDLIQKLNQLRLKGQKWVDSI